MEILAFSKGPIPDLMDEVTSKCKVLHATCGAGGSTIALSQVFDHVHAGDYSGIQLKAVRY